LCIPRVPSSDPDTPDSELVAAWRHGNPDALEALLGRHYDRLHALCRRVLGNEQDAQDATQEALIAIVRGLSNFDGRSAFSTWAYRVATNSAIDEMRRRGRRPVPGLDEARGADVSSDSGPSTAAALKAWVDPIEAMAARFDVDTALQQLPEEQRTAVVLRDLLDLDYAEIAEVLAIPIGTVRSRIARGRVAIGALLAVRNEEDDSAPIRAFREARTEKGNSMSHIDRQRDQDL
jgi:RNA polymerase sigma-70 factor (ECF subfamily)